MGLIIFMPSQNAAGLPTIGGANQSATLQASGTVAVVDERIAALWKAVPSRPGEETTVRRDCTASYLGNNFWLTAHHCVSSDMVTWNNRIKKQLESQISISYRHVMMSL